MKDGIWMHDVMVSRFQDAEVTTDRPPSHGVTDDSQASRTCIPPAGGGGGKGVGA